MANAQCFTRLGAFSLVAAALSWAGSEPSIPANSMPDVNPAIVQEESASLLSDAFIAQGMLQVYLDRAAMVTVYNARGQQIFQRESQSLVESVPLRGVTAGFVYLTVRAGKAEATRKLLYTGK